MSVSQHPVPGHAGDPWAAAPPSAVAARRRPWLAGLLSSILPGAGQVYGGRLLRSLWFLLPVAALAGAGLALASRGPMFLAQLAVQPRWLWALLAANAAIALLRIAAAADAYRVAAWPRPGRARRSLGIAAALAVIAAPHVAVGVYAVHAIRLLDSVFAGDEVALSPDVDPNAFQGPAPQPATIAPLPAPLPSIAPASPGTAAEARELIPAADLDPVRPVIVPREAPMAAAPLAPIDPSPLPDRITVLLAGGDAGPDRGGLRTDTMMVATLDLVTGRAVVFGVPRNFGWVPLPPSFQDAFAADERELRARHPGVPRGPCRCFPDILNALRQATVNWTNTFPDAPDPGMEALRATVEHMLGLPIDYYVLVDMGGFVELVDALHGVDVVVTKRVRAEVSPAFPGEPWIEIDLQPGHNHLHGREALAYVRDRKGSSDYTRMQRQRCMVRSVAAAADPLTLARSFPRLADAIRGSTSTDIPLDLLPDLIGHTAGLDFDDIATVALTAPRYAAGDDGLGHPRADIPKMRAAVAEALAGGTPAGAESPDACG